MFIGASSRLVNLDLGTDTWDADRRKLWRIGSLEDAVGIEVQLVHCYRHSCGLDLFHGGHRAGVGGAGL